MEYYVYVQMETLGDMFIYTEDHFVVECFERGINKTILDSIENCTELKENCLKKFGTGEPSSIVILILRLIYRISHVEFSLEASYKD